MRVSRRHRGGFENARWLPERYARAFWGQRKAHATKFDLAAQLLFAQRLNSTRGARYARGGAEGARESCRRS
jgi:hypothetical protein